MILRIAAVLSLGLGLTFTVTVLPRAKPDINSTEPLPPVETIVVVTAPEKKDAEARSLTAAEQEHKIEDIEDRLRAIQKTVNRIEMKADTPKGN